MPKPKPNKVAVIALALAVLATALVTVAQPAVAASGDCNAENTLSFGVTESDSLLRPTDVEDIWVVDIPDLNGNTAFLDVTNTGSEKLDFEVYEKSGSCNRAHSGDVSTGKEVTGLDENQRYWMHVQLDPNSDSGQYDILVDEE